MGHSDHRLRELAGAHGIYLDFHDLHGSRHNAQPETLRALLRALGVEASSPAQVEEALSALGAQSDGFPTETIVRAGEAASIPVPSSCKWTLVNEAGQIAAEGSTQDHIQLPALLIGYYQLHAKNADWAGDALVMCRPHRAPDIPSKTGHPRCWGATGALYGLRSKSNGGLGSYDDLGDIAAVLGQAGAQFIGVNPLHSLGWAMEDIISPYSPSHRGAFNTDHIATANSLGNTPAQEFIDYPDFRVRHRAELERSFESFTGSLEHAHFEKWKATCSQDVVAFSQFEAISETHGFDFRLWPTKLQAPGAAAKKAAGARAEFHLWLQWMAESQIGAAQVKATQSGMSLGLYLDLAVGPRPDGAEVWMNAATIAKGVSIGAPPDHLSPEGQSWALAAHAPGPLKSEQYRPLRGMLRTLMAKCGLLRIDHALGLLRSYWLPDDGSPGGYISQPLESLLAVITIEAHRANCVVVGEDLGLVPNGFREAMNSAGLYSYAVWQYETNDHGDILPANVLPPYSLACFGTHDTPTLNGFWHGTDIEWWRDVGWLTSNERTKRHGQRAQQRNSLRHVTGVASHAAYPDIADRIQGELAQSPAALVSVQLDDVFGELEAQNLPGTINEHPNWRRRLSVPVQDMATNNELCHLSTVMNSHRGRSSDDLDHTKEISA